MKPDHAKEMLPIITAFAEGKTIQHANTNGGWTDVTYLDVVYPASHFRIKPEPRVFYLAICKRESARNKVGDVCPVDMHTYSVAKGSKFDKLYGKHWDYIKVVEQLD